MDDKVVPKMIKSNLRGVLLLTDGIFISKLLKEYKLVTNEKLDYMGMGFSHIIEFLKAVPDVARIDTDSEYRKLTKVFGIPLNNLNITANKSCFQANRDVLEKENCSIKMHSYHKNSNQYKHYNIRYMPPESNKLNDSRTTSLKDEHSQFDPVKIILNKNLESKSDKCNISGTSAGGNFGNIPPSMNFMKLKMMFNDVCPSVTFPMKHELPSIIDIMVTHVEPLSTNYFWGIITNPYVVTIDQVLSLDRHENLFQKFNGGKKAVIFCKEYYCRIWVKSIQNGEASVFMVDFGNSEQVSATELKSSPDIAWKHPPIVVAFRHDKNKNFDTENHVNERYRCWLSHENGYIIEVDKMELI